MARTRIILDPSGYKIAAEPSYDKQLTGDQILSKFIKPNDAELTTPAPPHELFSPPGSTWLTCKPRQFGLAWYNDPRLSENVLTVDQWVYSPELVVEQKEWRTALPGVSPIVENVGQFFTVPASVTPLESTLYTGTNSIEDALGFTLPTGMATVARATETPLDTPISGETGGRGYTPSLEWIQYPHPRDVWIFGFAQWALVFAPEMTYILKRLGSGTGDRWHLRQAVLPGAGRAVEAIVTPGGSGGVALQASAEPRRLLCAYVGLTDLYFFPRIGYEGAVRFKAVPSWAPGTQIGIGHWWIGAAPGQKIALQAQITGYNVATTAPFFAGTTKPVIFDLGGSYIPSVNPKLKEHAFVWTPMSNNDVVRTDGGSLITVSSPGTLSSIEWQLCDEAGDPWDSSDGTHYSGAVKINLTPTPGDDALPGTGDYLSPQIERLEFRFESSQSDRVATPLELDDTKYSRWSVETFIDEPLGKRIEVDLTPAGTADVVANDFDIRGGYAIHIMEDTAGDLSYSTLRAAGWVEKPDLKLLKAEAADGGPYVQGYRMTGHGLLKRADQPWMYLPTVTNPDDAGFIEHDFALRETLRSVGFDVDDLDVYDDYPDSSAGTNVSRMPGTWGRAVQTGAAKVGPVWGPDWDETKVEYCWRIARKWRGWSLYETLTGLVRYHPDLDFELMHGVLYFPAATLYRIKVGTASAAAAGYPNQVFFPNAVRQQIEPLGNVVRVVGKDEDAETLHLISRDTESYGADHATYQNGLGEPKVIGFPLVDKMAVDTDALKTIGHIRLWDSTRRRVRWPVICPLAAWAIGATGVEVGKVITLQGRGDMRIIHMRVEQLKSAINHPITGVDQSVYNSQITAEELPRKTLKGNSVTAGAFSGAYPGLGSDAE
jgi:hypothetical protein